jgi:WD40 repeat protein
VTRETNRAPQVWDCFGRLLFQSEPLEYAVTAVAWSPDGELFAAGSFNALQLCDKTGWTHAKQTTDTGKERKEPAGGASRPNSHAAGATSGFAKAVIVLQPSTL